MAVVRALGATAESENAKLIGGQPSVCEENGRLVGGIQVGYERPNGLGVFRNWRYTDLFYFNPTVNTHEPTTAVTEVVAGMADGNGNELELSEQAWSVWLGAMHELLQRSPGTLYRDSYTGEIGLNSSIFIEHRRPLELPII